MLRKINFGAENGVVIGENDAKLTGNLSLDLKTTRTSRWSSTLRWTGEIDSGVEFRKPSIQLQLASRAA